MAGGCSLDLRAAPEMVDEVCDFTDKLTFQGSDCPSKKLCVDCGTSKTPLWRGGPAGPKSLCNACGIRSRKKRWALLQITNASIKKDNNISEKKMKRTVVDTSTNSNTNGSICNSTSSSSSRNSSDSSSKDKLMAMWEVLKPRNVNIEELNEEQQAAVLLMALSHGFNYS